MIEVVSLDAMDAWIEKNVAEEDRERVREQMKNMNFVPVSELLAKNIQKETKRDNRKKNKAANKAKRKNRR